MAKIADLTPDLPLGNIRWFPTAWNLVNQGQVNQAVVGGRVYMTHFWIPRRTIASRLAIRLGVGDAGSQARLGLYADMGGTPVGAAVLVDSGILSSGAAGVLTATFPPITLQKGLVWLAFICGSGIVQFVRNTTADYFTDLAGEFLQGCSYNQAFGPFANPCPGVALNVNARISGMMRIDSIE